MRPDGLNTSDAAAQDQIATFLRALAGNAPRHHYLELRARTATGGMRACFYAVHALERAADAICELAARTDVYVGVCPRTHRAGTKDAVAEAWTLWAETDDREASERALRHRPPPAIVVHSGTSGHAHLYWPLSHPLTGAQAEAANRRLAATLGADERCVDAGRILRPPATLNHKTNPPRPVALERHTLARYQAGTVLAATRVLPQPARQPAQQRPTLARAHARDPLLAIEPPAYVRALLGVEVPPSGKLPCPFHPDRHPSFHVYPTAERGWYCYGGCGGGSIYDLAARLWNLTPRGREFHELRSRLRHHLHLELDRSLGRDAP
jgi:hypothetical protein